MSLTYYAYALVQEEEHFQGLRQLARLGDLMHIINVATAGAVKDIESIDDHIAAQLEAAPEVVDEDYLGLTEEQRKEKRHAKYRASMSALERFEALERQVNAESAGIDAGDLGSTLDLVVGEAGLSIVPTVVKVEER
jgi:hypothetical protein